jgi:hypothetical protein
MDHSDQGPTKGQATLRRAEGEAGPRLLTASWQESQGPRCNSGVVGLPGLEPGTILIRVLCTGLFPEDRAGNLRERPTVGDRWRPLETVANRSAPMACGPNVDQAHRARGGSGAAPGDPWLARETPRRLFPTSKPCPGNRL